MLSFCISATTVNPQFTHHCPVFQVQVLLDSRSTILRKAMTILLWTVVVSVEQQRILRTSCSRTWAYFVIRLPQLHLSLLSFISPCLQSLLVFTSCSALQSYTQYSISASAFVSCLSLAFPAPSTSLFSNTSLNFF